MSFFRSLCLCLLVTALFPSVGLSALRSSPSFGCHSFYWDAVFDGEIGASRTILAAGYNIACLLPVHAEVEFRGLDGFKYCEHYLPKQYRNPFFEPPANISINPYDILFYKFQNKGE